MHDPIYNLANMFKKLPGIGERQAYRIVYDILSKDKSFTENLISELRKIQNETILCPMCFRRYPNDQMPICDICASQKTDQKTLLVVERDTDLNAIIRTGLYNGLYFVLGGSVPVLDKEPAKKIRLQELHKRVLEMPNLQEIILATSMTPAGENTNEIIRVYLKNYLNEKSVAVKSLGRGISTGTELEYIDPDTLMGALQNRS